MESWTGRCQLVRIDKLRDMEFPLPSVELEAIYRPRPLPGSRFTPPDARRQFTALSKHEEALQDHLQAQAEVSCFVNPPPPGQCVPGAMVVDVAPFDAATAVAKTPEQPKGCASIESTSNQDAIASSTKDSTQHVITERFVFEDGSSALPADAATQADAVAARLKQTPELQCVGVVGQWVRGENAAVAFARARAVRELLIERGVEPERLVALTVDAPMVGLTGTPEPPKAEDRRVSISVLLDVTRTAP